MRESQSSRAAYIVVLSVALTSLMVSVVVFHAGLELSWLDSVYFVVTTFTSVGYGDISLYDAPPAIKLFGIVVMITGVVIMTTIFALITQQVLRAHLESIFGKRKKPVKNHVVLCGLGAVGIRTLEHLARLHEDIIVIEQKSDSRHVATAQQMGIPVIAGDARLQSVLEQAYIKDAQSIIAATDNDLVNLESALSARAINPDIRVVIRVFDHNFADKIKTAFGFSTAFSTSSLAAPAFAMAALDPSVVGSFYVGDQILLNIDITVNENAKLAWMTTHELMQEGECSVLAHVCGRTKKQTLNPSSAIRLAPQDRIMLSAQRENLAKIHELNSPVKKDSSVR